MKNTSYLQEGIRITTELLDDIIFLCETRVKKTYFTRIGRNKMGFKSMILFILNFVKNTVQVELDNFFKMTTGKDINVTKQAYTEARQKISPKAFIKMSDAVIRWFYRDTDFNKYRGYRLLSIDGTVLEVHNSEKLREEFGYIENKTLKVARARGAALYDGENDMILTSHIGRYKQGEREVAEILIE
ncbi:MAG: IS4 family transposase, partial [Clostridium sp.]